jgi:class 3 adenylate cyclase/tetratricopeptide (TPR) repeat protein
MLSCPACGRDNPADALFCNGCGTALGLEPDDRREERKVVTVLFADLVGFTSRAERMDPEDVRGLLTPYWQHLRDELERFGGTVEKFIGDAVMALFGAPVAHEDDPERAVRAALAIRDWVRESGEDLQVRIAVNTGEALVLLGARPGEGEGMAAGDVVNTAARMQSAASVNGILVGETTYRSTRDTIDYAARDPVIAKGKAEPITTWEPVQAKSRAAVELVSGGAFVGRQHELDLLAGALARARREREPQLATVSGVPGIGKSRLVRELFALVDADEEIIRWRSGRSLPYGDGISLWALGEIVKAELGLLESDDREEAETKLAQSLEEVIPDPSERDWVEMHLRPLVGLGESVRTSENRSESFAAWRRYLEALADRRPTVLVFEDLQWADDGLLDFIDELVEWVTDVALLVVCTTRPELLDRRPGWGGGKRNALTVSLASLSDEETARIVMGALDQPLLPAETQAAVLARAGGNPLYAEQYARMLAEGLDTTADLPETVQGIIAARLDLLPSEEKALLQDAAVLGRVFWPAALTAVGADAGDGVEERVSALVRKEFVRRDRRSSLAGETEYLFAHGLVRDVAYAQIPRGARAEKHRRVAEWIETLSPDRAADRAEMLAHHYTAALEFGHAAGLDMGDLLEPARKALHDAGDRAAALNSFTAAQAHYIAALQLWPESDPDRPRVLLAHAEAGYMLGASGAIADLGRAVAALIDVGDLEGAAVGELLSARSSWYAGLRDDADAHADRALELLADAPPAEAKVGALAERARLLMLRGENARSSELATQGLELARELGLERLEASLLITRGTCALADDTNDDLSRGVEIAERVKDLDQLYRGLNNLAEAAIRRGDLAAADRLYLRMRTEQEALGLRTHLLWTGGQASTVRFETGDWDAALKLAEPLIAEAEAGRPHVLESQARGVRGTIRYARGDAAGALADGRRGVVVAREAKDPQTVGPALALLAQMLIGEGERSEARELVDELLELHTEVEPYYTMSVYLLWPAYDLGLARASSEIFETSHGSPWIEAALAVWRGDLETAADAYARHGATVLEADTRLRAAAQLRAAGNQVAADDQLARAIAFYRSVGATRRTRDAEALLAATA